MSNPFHYSIDEATIDHICLVGDSRPRVQERVQERVLQRVQPMTTGPKDMFARC
jgi:hypothetical protein